jgi:transposase-like protein
MGDSSFPVRQFSRRHAPRQAPCPHCGRPGRRKQLLHRTVRDLAYREVVLVHLTTAEYRARCGCCRTFRTQVDGLDAKARYTQRVRQAVLDRLLEDRMSLEGVQAALARDFDLALSTGYLYDCLDWQVRRLDHAAYRARVVQEFSGTLCVDEIHLGRSTLLLATDPLRDQTVACAVVQHNDQAHMGRFLGQLRDHGLHPRVVVTDGSALYPALLERLWPQAEHQLCIFHVLKDVHDYVMAGVRRRLGCLRRRAAAGQRRRPRRRGRRRRADAARHSRQRSLQREAAFVYRHRFLMVTRRDRLRPWQRRQLQQLLEYLPSLRGLRRFVEAVHRLLAAAQTEAQARQRYEDLRHDPEFTSDPDLVPALNLLAPAQFEKMIAFLRSPVGQRVRTNNHVERLNRQLRYCEKVRYRWRRPRRIVAFVLLQLHRQEQWRPPTGREPPSGPAGRARAAPGPATPAAPRADERAPPARAA